MVLTLATTLAAQALFHKPVKVFGDPNFIGTAGNPLAADGIGPNVVEGRELNLPAGVALDNSVSPPNVYIADSGNNRVLGFRYTTQSKQGSFADVILGQTDRFGNQSQGGANRSTGLNGPSGLAVDSAGNLYVADTGNNRILRYPGPLAQPGGAASPNMVIGQTSFSGKSSNAGGISSTSLALQTGSTFRSGIALDGAGNLWVADTGNNRVLRYPASVLRTGTNGPSADVVVGQADFVSKVPTAARTNKALLIAPQGIAFDPPGHLLVADSASRVLVYPSSISSNAIALRIIGVDTSPAATATTQIQLSNALGVSASANGIIVADTGNNRLMVYPTVDNFPAESTQFSPSATFQLGQPSFNVAKPNQGQPESSAMSFSAPLDIASSSSEFFVVDAQNNRVLVFPSVSGAIATSATRVIGQLDFPYNAPNLIEGKEFAFGLSQSSNVNGSAVLDQSTTPPHLYVADTQNNRILGFKDFTHMQNGQKADIVIGQPDFLRAQINYPTNDSTQPNSAGLHSPTSLAVDSAGNVYVADTGNSRILRFPAPFLSNKTVLESADLVIGQSDFNSLVTDPSITNLNSPIGIAFTADGANTSVANSGFLVVADSGHNRVLLFPKPFSNGMSSSRVLGQSNFTSGTGSADPQRFSVPRAVAVDPQDRVLVADTGNHRIQIFNKAASINNFDTPPISLTGAQSQPISLTSNASGFWVADGGANQLVHFPSVDQLGIKNNASDATQPVNQPLSVFADTYGNLLVGDGINRLLYFAPQLSIISAANYSARPLTAGSIASIYSLPVTNIIASGTGTFSTLPLPNVLADTQVLVNGAAAPLFFVSPGQINFVLSNQLPTGGSADVQVVRQSTSQIYGGAEIGLSAADPALFTSNSSGSGQVAAINFADGSINSALNPVARGQIIELYGTGVGPVPNAPPDGQAATGATPAPDKPQILIGTATVFVDQANISYSGLAPGEAGVWQINLMIPPDATVGSSVAIRVFEGSIPNVDPTGSIGVTTISIK